jgi:hypothetical protein
MGGSDSRTQIARLCVQYGRRRFGEVAVQNGGSAGVLLAPCITQRHAEDRSNAGSPPDRAPSDRRLLGSPSVARRGLPDSTLAMACHIVARRGTLYAAEAGIQPQGYRCINLRPGRLPARPCSGCHRCGERLITARRAADMLGNLRAVRAARRDAELGDLYRLGAA